MKTEEQDYINNQRENESLDEVADFYRSDTQEFINRIKEKEREYNKFRELLFLNKLKERLKGYACGYHKELNKMIDTRMKELKR